MNFILLSCVAIHLRRVPLRYARQIIKPCAHACKNSTHATTITNIGKCFYGIELQTHPLPPIEASSYVSMLCYITIVRITSIITMPLSLSSQVIPAAGHLQRTSSYRSWPGYSSQWLSLVSVTNASGEIFMVEIDPLYLLFVSLHVILTVI